MIKKLSTLLLAACLAVPSMAQTYSSNDGGVLYAPQKGQWQVSVFFGGSSTFYNEGETYRVLPNFTNTTGDVGLDGAGEIETMLNISGLNNNNLTNIVGFEGKYFLSNCWDINAQFSMNVNLTPKKDFVEGNHSVPDMIIPDQRYITAQMTNNWYVNIGSNHYFKTANARIHPYLGATVGFQMARIETSEPYTGDTFIEEDGEITTPEGMPVPPEGIKPGQIPGNELVPDVDANENGLPSQVYLPGSKAGQIFGIKAAGVAGIEYSLAPGLVLGFQFQPVAYRYDVVQICPKGFDRYNATHHNIKIFDMAMLKLGIRF